MPKSSTVCLLYATEDGEEWADYVVDVLGKNQLRVVRTKIDQSGKLSRDGLPLDGAVEETDPSQQQEQQSSYSVLIVMSTPKLLGTLLKSPSTRFDDLMPSSLLSHSAASSSSPASATDVPPVEKDDASEPAVMLLCGTFMKDLDELDSDQRKVSERFPRLERWTVVDHENYKSLPVEVKRLVKQQNESNRGAKPLLKKSSKPGLATPKTLVNKLQFKMVPTEAYCEVRRHLGAGKFRANETGSIRYFTGTAT